ncbi:unnamed protein product, partial [Allacma fusca]
MAVPDQQQTDLLPEDVQDVLSSLAMETSEEPMLAIVTHDHLTISSVLEDTQELMYPPEALIEETAPIEIAEEIDQAVSEKISNITLDNLGVEETLVLPSVPGTPLDEMLPSFTMPTQELLVIEPVTFDSPISPAGIINEAGDIPHDLDETIVQQTVQVVSCTPVETIVADQSPPESQKSTEDIQLIPKVVEQFIQTDDNLNEGDMITTEQILQEIQHTSQTVPAENSETQGPNITGSEIEIQNANLVLQAVADTFSEVDPSVKENLSESILDHSAQTYRTSEVTEVSVPEIKIIPETPEAESRGFSQITRTVHTTITRIVSHVTVQGMPSDSGVTIEEIVDSDGDKTDVRSMSQNEIEGGDVENVITDFPEEATPAVGTQSQGAEIVEELEAIVEEVEPVGKLVSLQQPLQLDDTPDTPKESSIVSPVQVMGSPPGAITPEQGELGAEDQQEEPIYVIENVHIDTKLETQYQTSSAEQDIITEAEVESLPTDSLPPGDAAVSLTDDQSVPQIPTEVQEIVPIIATQMQEHRTEEDSSAVEELQISEKQQPADTEPREPTSVVKDAASTIAAGAVGVVSVLAGLLSGQELPEKPLLEEVPVTEEEFKPPSPVHPPDESSSADIQNIPETTLQTISDETVSEFNILQQQTNIEPEIAIPVCPLPQVTEQVMLETSHPEKVSTTETQTITTEVEMTENVAAILTEIQEPIASSVSTVLQQLSTVSVTEEAPELEYTKTEQAPSSIAVSEAEEAQQNLAAITTEIQEPSEAPVVTLERQVSSVSATEETQELTTVKTEEIPSTVTIESPELEVGTSTIQVSSEEQVAEISAQPEINQEPQIELSIQHLPQVTEQITLETSVVETVSVSPEQLPTTQLPTEAQEVSEDLQLLAASVATEVQEPSEITVTSVERQLSSISVTEETLDLETV